MGSGKMWTDREIALLRANYPRYGADVSKWSERIERTTKSIQAMALRQDVSMKPTRLRLSIAQRGKLAKAFALTCDYVGVDQHDALHDLHNMYLRGLL